jgi:hypothetical protein
MCDTCTQHEYPGAWPGFFQDLLRAVLPGSALGAAGVGGQRSGPLAGVLPGNEGLVDMWCRILVSVDEDLVSLDIPRWVGGWVGEVVEVGGGCAGEGGRVA